MERLTGKVAWVKGAGSGIGEAGALALAEEGASVMLTGGDKSRSRRLRPASKRAAERRASTLGTCLALRTRPG